MRNSLILGLIAVGLVFLAEPASALNLLNSNSVGGLTNGTNAQTVYQSMNTIMPAIGIIALFGMAGIMVFVPKQIPLMIGAMIVIGLMGLAPSLVNLASGGGQGVGGGDRIQAGLTIFAEHHVNAHL